MRNIPYLIRQGFRGVFRHIGSSLFSLSIMVFTIFLFCGAAAIMMNINHFVQEAEENVGVTVFFNEGLSEAHIRQIGEKLSAHEDVKPATSTWQTGIRKIIRSPIPLPMKSS